MDRTCFQRAVPVHRQFGALDPGRIDAEPLGKGRFRAFSAGSHPAGRGQSVRAGVAGRRTITRPSGLRSKPWDEFAQPGAPQLDFVFTVCDNAAGEVCPVWPGQPMTAHWGIPDPAAVEGSDEPSVTPLSMR